MKRTLAVAMAALGLIGWVDPKTVGPTASQSAVDEETKRQAVFLLNSRLKEIQRVSDIAFRLQVANQDLCAERRPRLGMTWGNIEGTPTRLREAAKETLHLGPGVSVTEIIRQGPAATAGLKLGDALVSMNGEAAPAGKTAPDKFSKRLAEILRQSPDKPVTLVVRRDDQLQTLEVKPIMTCAYDVVVEDGSDINAYADGRTVHILRPIIRFAADDEELALVIAHELAHNGQRHIQAKQKNAGMAGLGGLLLDGIAAANGVNTEGAFTKAAANFGASHASADFEAEADYVGMYYMARAGYPTEGVENFWRRMAVEAPGTIFVKSDHPATPNRFLAIAATSQEIEAKRAKGDALVPNQRSK